jgi:hypothetical protein
MSNIHVIADRVMQIAALPCGDAIKEALLAAMWPEHFGHLVPATPRPPAKPKAKDAPAEPNPDEPGLFDGLPAAGVTMDPGAGELPAQVAAKPRPKVAAAKTPEGSPAQDVAPPPAKPALPAQRRAKRAPEVPANALAKAPGDDAAADAAPGPPPADGYSLGDVARMGGVSLSVASDYAKELQWPKVVFGLYAKAPVEEWVAGRRGHHYRIAKKETVEE